MLGYLMIDDCALIKAAVQVENAIVHAIPEEEHRFSRDFEQKMARLLRRAAHPALTCALRSAACIVLGLLLAGTLVLTFHAEARAKTLGWLREQYEDVVRFFLQRVRLFRLIAKCDTNIIE